VIVMPKLSHLRVLIDDEPQSGAWNMAVDEVLLDTAIERDLATLRFYRWCEPTASLGYFQSEADFLAETRFSQLPSVRRLSGGGTLIHDFELTYSLTLPASQRLVARPPELYLLVHQAFIEVFAMRGVPLGLRGVTVHRPSEPLLCFAREDEHDLVLSRHKVLGSAQRRRRGAILQHGGLVLQASPVTPELPGIGDLSSQWDWSGLDLELAAHIGSFVSESSAAGSLSTDERDAVARRIYAADASVGRSGRVSN